ncbi:hypothetical protein ACIBO5_54145 [Nonomuraea angiospora]|uniref:hypothetical protein n=1 Tax=Nonomuraea angiospora TaxID=46172 RepID=UPI003795900A
MPGASVVSGRDRQGRAAQPLVASALIDHHMLFRLPRRSITVPRLAGLGPGHRLGARPARLKRRPA